MASKQDEAPMLQRDRSAPREVLNAMEAEAAFTRFGAWAAVVILLAVFVLGLRAGNLQVCMEAHPMRADFHLDTCEPFSNFLTYYYR